MDFFLESLKDTLEAINKLIDNNINVVNTKRVRRCNNVKSSNRSKINFIWRSLDFLEKEGILELNGENSPKTYKIKLNKKVNVEELLSQIENRKDKLL